MHTDLDIENVTKAAQTANLLVSDIKSVYTTTKNELLSDIYIDLLQRALDIEKKLKKYESILGNKND